MDIHLNASDVEREACAQIMADSDPWRTLGYGYDESLERFRAPDCEIYVLTDGDVVAGFAIVVMQGVLSGYLQGIGLAASYRGSGHGARLLRFVEQRIFREKPNVFLFVSLFNTRAQKLYESFGYETIGNVRDFLVKGHDEILMRKTIGPIKSKS